MNIEQLKSKKSKLEYELVEEKFHYESIPHRRDISAKKALFAIICAVPTTIITVASVLLIGEGPGEDALLGVAILLASIIGIFCLIASVYLWRVWYVEYSKIHGMNRKWSNYGAKDYKEEQEISSKKIKDLTEEIKELSLQINSIREMNVVKDFTLSDNLTEDDPFFNYAYGIWGDEKEKLLIEMKHGKYEREKESLLLKIEEQQKILRQVGVRRNVIDDNYEILSGRVILFILSIFIIVFVQIAFFEKGIIAICISIGGIIYAIVGTSILIATGINPFFSYKVEHKYIKYRDFAERHHMKTTAMQMKEIMKKIDTMKNRLEYVDKILEYKNGQMNENEAL